MKNFYYLIRFNKRNENNYQININLEYHNYLIPVFNRTFTDDKKASIFKQIYNYFHQTHIKMTKNEAELLYNLFKHDGLILPNPYELSELEPGFRLTRGLTPKEILFLIYINDKPVKRKIAKYWEDEYHLDTEHTIKHLLFLGYLTKDDFRYNLEKATKREICTLLEKYQLPTTGNKKELINLVKTHIPIEVQKEHFSGLYYHQTIKGEQIVLLHQCLNDFHKSYYRYAHNLRIEEFYLLSKRYKDLDAKDVCKMLIDSKSEEVKEGFTWEFAEDEEKEIQDDFVEIINRNYNDDHESKIEVSDALFLNIINKEDKEKEDIKEVEDKENDAVFYQIINKKINVEENIEDIVEDVDEEIEEEKEVDKPNILSPFIKSFVYSSLLIIVVVYIIIEYMVGR